MLKQVSSIALKQVSKQIEAINVFFDFRIELVIRNMRKEQKEVYETRQIVDMSKRKNNSKCRLEICESIGRYHYFVNGGVTKGGDETPLHTMETEQGAS